MKKTEYPHGTKIEYPTSWWKRLLCIDYSVFIPKAPPRPDKTPLPILLQQEYNRGYDQGVEDSWKIIKHGAGSSGNPRSHKPGKSGSTPDPATTKSERERECIERWVT